MIKIEAINLKEPPNCPPNWVAGATIEMNGVRFRDCALITNRKGGLNLYLPRTNLKKGAPNGITWADQDIADEAARIVGDAFRALCPDHAEIIARARERIEAKDELKANGSGPSGQGQHAGSSNPDQFLGADKSKGLT